ncbi:unnamed protein product [Rhizophagus irregularis]|nr:unnamed protein product [Rhizophagus irregularis]
MEEGFRARYKKDSKFIREYASYVSRLRQDENPDEYTPRNSWDHVDSLSNLSLEENEELLAINNIGDYWSEKPPKKNIHVIVEPLVSTTTSASNEILELKEHLASLQALLNMHSTLSLVRNERVDRKHR